MRRETLGEAVDRDGVSEAFMALAGMLERRGHVPFKDKVITEKVGAWTVVLNGTSSVLHNAGPPDSMGCPDLPPVHAAIFYNGWLAGEVSPASGWFVAGEGAYESAFIEAMAAMP